MTTGSGGSVGPADRIWRWKGGRVGKAGDGGREEGERAGQARPCSPEYGAQVRPDTHLGQLAELVGVQQ